MRWLRPIILISFAFALVLLDASFFSFLEFSGVTILSSLSVLIAFVLLGHGREISVFIPAIIVFFAVFSSLPLWFIVVGFWLLPATLAYLRIHYLPEPSMLAASLSFAITYLLFDLLLVVTQGEWLMSEVAAIGWFTVINTIFGLTVYGLARTIRSNFVRSDIRL
ncbi:MAG: hypothetical protein BWY68_00199 [bacterium ADurb.Bin400]|nr:MAG: hypothetical protein BWY68_00199 [bacterium ADurb.Bin400]